MNSVPSSERAVLYDRVSTALQSKVGYSGGADGFQLDKCREHADRRGYHVVGQFTDVDSGAKWNIDGIMGALELAERRAYDVLIVSDTSRFARNLAKKTVYEADLRRSGVRVEYLNLPSSADSAEDRFISNVFGALDELERERIAYRTKNGRRQKAKDGKVVGGGHAPYGYAFDTVWSDERKRDVPVGLKIVEKLADVVRRIYRDARTLSCVDIASKLSAEGVPTPTGRGSRWGKSTVRRILQSTIYRGVWTYVDIEVAVAPLVDDVTWHAIQRRLVERRVVRRGRDPARSVEWLLRGRLICGHCQHPLSVNSNSVGGASAVDWPNGQQRRYSCARATPCRVRAYGYEPCTLPTLLAADDRPIAKRTLDGVEDLAWEHLLDLYLEPGLFERQLASVDDATSDVVERWERRLAELDAQIEKYRQRARRAREEKVEYERGSDGYQQYADDEAAAEAALKTFRRERDAFLSSDGPSLKPDQRAALISEVESLRTLYATALEAAEAAPLDVRRPLFEHLQISGIVREDASGERVGRDARVSIEWTTVLSSAQSVLTICSLHKTTGPVLLSVARA